MLDFEAREKLSCRPDLPLFHVFESPPCRNSCCSRLRRYVKPPPGRLGLFIDQGRRRYDHEVACQRVGGSQDSREQYQSGFCHHRRHE
jgi:hypothetical protein